MGGGTRRGVMSDPNLRQVSETAEACPRCDMIFTMLETNSAGERVQHIEMMERGEGICFEARVLPFDLSSYTQTTLGARAQSFAVRCVEYRKPLTRLFSGVPHTNYIGRSCASFRDTGKLSRFNRIDRRAENCDSKRPADA